MRADIITAGTISKQSKQSVHTFDPLAGIRRIAQLACLIFQTALGCAASTTVNNYIGKRFRLHRQLIPNCDAIKEEVSALMEAVKERLRNLRILIVDDDKDTREMLRFVLEHEGGQVTAASTVGEALEEYKRLVPNVVVADIGMPGANGYALIALIRALDRQSGRSTPAIALTAYTSPADRQTALAAGFQRYMSKPFVPAEIIEATCAVTEELPVNVATTIQKHHDEIMRLWNEEARRCTSARGLTTPAFEKLMPEFLSALALAGGELGRLSGRRRDLVERHLSARIRQGFDLPEIIEEIAILGRVVSSMWAKAPVGQWPDAAEVERFFGELNAASTAAADIFREHMSEDEQKEKRYARLLLQVATEALGKDQPPLQQWIKDALQLIMEAMDAEAATLLLLDSDGRNLMTAGSVGLAEGIVEKHVTTSDPSSFVLHVAANEEPVAVSNALTTELQVDDILKRKGIHALLGVRIARGNKVEGVLYIGVTGSRPFSTRELRGIETLADRMTVHLDNARLYARLQETSRDLQEKVAALTMERTLHELFMSILAHDLRGPLTVAKMASVILASHPETLDERRDLAAKIDANIDRAERMIRDLLDANRIRVNERLPLRLDEADLGDLVRSLGEELAAIHGKRFILNLDQDVRGIWDAEQLRRAMWNLAINAVKYGAADKPITISAKHEGAGVGLSVHNYGPVIASKDQAHLFDPFSRTRQAQSGEQIGWGLGLTLVRGCAEAHGGTVTVQSSTASGTTFTLHLPLDSRPYELGKNSAA
jgi:signal transduction histidine kinase/DNA-binding response OmpR family regulator